MQHYLVLLILITVVLMELGMNILIYHSKNHKITRFLGTSGENINNLYCFTEGLDSIELLEMTLKWSHVAPTTPDTLGMTSTLY